MMTMRTALAAALMVAALVSASGCRVELDAGDEARSRTGSVTVYFNSAATRPQQHSADYADQLLVQSIDTARTEIDFAVMGFTKTDVVDALVRAHYRGVRLRFVGDAAHLESDTWGYQVMDRLGIPMMVGNFYRIMHLKFFVIDRRFVFVGTGNISSTDMARNDNNWMLIDSPPVAADFSAEFEQLLAGRFGGAKRPIDNGNVYQIGDTTLEVYFSPQEDAMGRILEAVDGAQQSIEFTIFAFTKDQVGAGFVERQQVFQRYNRCCDPATRGGLTADEVASCAVDVTCVSPFVAKGVRGVVDRSQLHSNGPYHEAYRLLAFGVPIRLDGNESSAQPGDYQAGGGRQHSKTMVIDAGTPNATVLTGSFNWSAAATTANDEVLFVIRNPNIAAQYTEAFASLWLRASDVGNDFVGPGGTVPDGGVVFNELHWDGWNGDIDPTDAGGDDVANDEFIELLNTTDRAIDLSMWVVASDEDFVMGFYPGTIIGPHERFLVVDHNVDPFQDSVPQLFGGAFQNANFVMNTANDPRFLRLNLHDAQFRLRLLDPRGNVADVAGDGGPPFFGGRSTEGGVVRNRSMERVHPLRSGGQRDAWQRCGATRGGQNVRDAYRERVIATPGEPNASGEPDVPAFDPRFRAPSP